MFDKKEYWKNRKADKRGQGEVPIQKFTPVPGKHFISMAGRPMLVNRAAARSNRDYDRPDKPVYDKPDPKTTNHQRHLMRIAARSK